MATWVVREDGGSWRVRCGRVRRDFATEDEVVRFVRTRASRGDEVVLEEADGYRIPLSPRRHWRS